jgi:uncharacterized protein involved in exopolysaccharide biosynthesis
MANDPLPPHPDDIEGLGLDAGDIVRLYARHVKLMVGVVVGLVLLVTLAVYLAPPTYVATAELLVARNEPDVSEGAPERPVTALERGEALATEAEILTSEGLVRRCLQDHKRLSAAPTETDYVKLMLKYVIMPFKALGLIYEGDDPEADRVRNLVKRINVSEHVDANTLDLSFEHDSPDVAQKALGALIDTYLRFRIETLREPELEEHYEERMEGLSGRIDDVEGRVLEVGRKSGMIQPDIEMNLAVTHLAELRNEAIDLEIERQATLGRLDEIARLLDEQDSESVLRRESGRNPAWLSLHEAVTNLQRRYEVMKVTYKDGAEPLEAVATELEQVKALAARTPEMITTTEVRGRGEAVQSLVSDHNEVLALLAGLERRLAATQSEIEERSSDLREMNRWATELARADAEMAAVSGSYQVYLKKREDALLSSIADRRQINVKVIQPAIRPDKPSMPRLIPIILAGIAGIALAFGLATALELVNGTVRNERDVERTLGVPLLASLDLVPEEKNVAAA